MFIPKWVWAEAVRFIEWFHPIALWQTVLGECEGPIKLVVYFIISYENALQSQSLDCNKHKLCTCSKSKI